jgi:lipoprotein-anchoring transpeptidase ErfK/SrfK
MKQRSFIIIAAALAILLIGSVAVYAYDSAHDDQIADGVTVGGVDVGGMRTAAARTKIERALRRNLDRPLYATYHDRRYELPASEARVRIDTRAMVGDALQRSRDGNVVTRTFRGVFGGKVRADIPVEASYSKDAVSGFVKHVGDELDRPARDASLDFSTGQLQSVKAEKGREVRQDALRADVSESLARPSGDRQVPVSVEATMPKVTTKDLASKYGTVIAINRGAFTLTLFKRLHKVKSYTIAVGRQGLETPAGEYTVTDKQIDPSWHVPNSDWAGKLAGKVIPPGPDDPLKARWIGIVDGAGIHGTDEVGSLGTAGSHGCIRMAVPDVIDLYERTPYGSKIFIH